MRELHNELISSVAKGGLEEARNRVSGEVIISASVATAAFAVDSVAAASIAVASVAASSIAVASVAVVFGAETSLRRLLSLSL